MACTPLNDFIKSVEIILPGLRLMGEVIEACGLKCEVNHLDDNGWQIGCRWKRDKMSMNLTLDLGGTDEIAWLQLWDKNGDNVGVQAWAKNGEIDWLVMFSDSVRADSPLFKLEEDIRTLVPEHDRGHGYIDLPNEFLVREVVNMTAVLFKRQG